MQDTWEKSACIFRMLSKQMRSAITVKNVCDKDIYGLQYKVVCFLHSLLAKSLGIFMVHPICFILKKFPEKYC